MRNRGTIVLFAWGFSMSKQKVRFIQCKPKGIKDATWQYVVEAWENGLSDREAAFFASKHEDSDEITAENIRMWCKDMPEVGELRANLQSDLLSRAKIKIAESLGASDREAIRTARWYLERKAADEFSTKQAVAFEGAVVELSMEEKEKALKELMEQFHNGEQ